MKKVTLSLLILMVGAVWASISFYPIDTFEDGTYGKWYAFDRVGLSIINNPEKNKNDTIADSCGDYSLRITGEAENWYAGGMGTQLNMDASDFYRVQLDLYGGKLRGKIKLEMYEKAKGKETEEKWMVEIPVLGEGFTRYSIPFTAFNQETNENKFHGPTLNTITKFQIIFITQNKKGNIDLALDNILLTR